MRHIFLSPGTLPLFGSSMRLMRKIVSQGSQICHECTLIWVLAVLAKNRTAGYSRTFQQGDCAAFAAISPKNATLILHFMPWSAVKAQAEYPVSAFSATTRISQPIQQSGPRSVRSPLLEALFRGWSLFWNRALTSYFVSSALRLGIGRKIWNSMAAAIAIATTVQKLKPTSPVARPTNWLIIRPTHQAKPHI